MLVKIFMKDKETIYKGLKCGSEGSLLYLVNPVLLSEDERGKVDGFLESPVGDEVNCGMSYSENVRLLLLPINDIEKIESSED